nr:hypothetical protein [Tanacetum cinerariifolium]
MSAITDVRRVLIQEVDDFACPASFLWHTAKHVIRDPSPVMDDFNAPDFATLVVHPSPFWKFPKAFMCLVGLSRHYTLDEETFLWFVHKDGERRGGQDANIQLVVEAMDTIAEDAATM